MKRFSLVFIAAVTLVTLFSPISSAGAKIESWPDCGDFTITTPGEYSDSNLSIVYRDGGVDFNSFNGWKFYHYEIFGINQWGATFPNGATSDYAELGTDTTKITKIVVDLKKDCPAASAAEPKCKTTDLYVYTLLGNYPCNLVTTDYPIPPRFMNREYTGPLCQLPNLEFQWNGKWIVNQVKDCGGYQVGGNFYNSSLPALP